jgi:hypothetical protein
MFYEQHEIYGSELERVKEKKEGQYTIEELQQGDLLDRDRIAVALLEQIVHGRKVFVKLFEII